MISRLDSFIEANDREASMDTSSRLTKAELDSFAADDELSRDGQTSTTPNGTKGIKIQTRASPASPSDQDHPLKHTPTRTPDHSKLGRSNTMKRLSLIQPVVSSSPTPKDHRQSQPALLKVRTRSQSVRSGHSRSSSAASEVQQQRDAGESVNSLLQLLANKELELLETKRKIDELRKGLNQEEAHLQLQTQQLQDLKTQVGKTVYNGMDDHKYTKTVQSAAQPSQSKKSGPTTLETPRLSSNRESMWSKPLTFFNQFDQLIQHELEKKLHWDEVPLPKKPSNAEQEPHSKPSDDVLGNVSSSLWSFVSDVRSGLMGINEEETTEQETLKSQRRSRNPSPLKFVGKEMELEDLQGKKANDN
ncbi:LAME_0E01222g1_1 [Lachancea meyersii CBS 8951]|uniref:Topoisomerase I damage affected protein 11 n=1 Tax=Lachancea meyersii CBS 8951 TaxID=1266667 RepID=A0A1G4JEZ1_9SACH|nr:LAME_0E01222g1_1 [Lachancea meyersii CBS 8951]